MIQNFKDKETQKIFERQRSRKLPSGIQQVALRKLRMLDVQKAFKTSVFHQRIGLERLVGDRQGQYRIRVNDQWRICFERKDGELVKIKWR